MSECYCDYEPAEFFSAAIHKARKPHQCSECDRMIQFGQPYEAANGKWDGEFNTFKMCEPCMKLRDWVKAHVPCFCWAYGNLHDDALETVREYAHHAPGLMFSTYRLIVNAKRQPQWKVQP